MLPVPVSAFGSTSVYRSPDPLNRVNEKRAHRLEWMEKGVRGDFRQNDCSERKVYKMVVRNNSDTHMLNFSVEEFET